MKLILYMALSANGYIARENDETPWSDAQRESYREVVNEHGALIMGRKTFHLMMDEGRLENLGNPFVVVLSASDSEGDGNVAFVKSPEEAIDILKRRGLTSAVLGGGATTNTAFLEANAVDEVLLDVEPHLFGAGVRLCAPGLFEKQMVLLNVKRMGENTVQLHYRVQR